MDVFAEALVEPVFRGATMQKLMRMTERVGRNTAAVLITGETGTGKELIARAIHRHSLRCCKPWVDINCTTLPEHLVESELFGYEKGAFSGADARKEGLFELAHKGTLFLDEIGEINPKVQVKLLRVLDGAPYYRLGGNTKVAVDVRVIATCIIAWRSSTSTFRRFVTGAKMFSPLPNTTCDCTARTRDLLLTLLPPSRHIPGRAMFANCETLS